MTEELKKEIMDILDNVRYWETCPEDYKIRIKAISEQLIIGGVMPRSLTAENGAKTLLIGEFFEEHECRHYDSDGELVEYTEKVPVSWSTIKDIYSKIVSHYGA